MPELTEVEHVRRIIHRTLLGVKIDSASAKEDPIVFQGVERSEVESKLTGRTIVDTKRWGKYYVLIMDKGPSIVGHLGMTGWVYIEIKHKQPVDGKEKEMACECRMCLRKDPKHVWPPRFWKLQLTFETPHSHITLAYDDARRLGRVRLVEGDPMKELPISKLGFDPLHNLPALSEFTQMVQRRAVPIKALLLDQSFSAGVGNWVADEVLWHAKIHPGHYTNILTDKECETIHEKLSYVCRVAAEVDADSRKFPDNWLFLHRWSKGKGKSQLPDGNTISFETFGGRTSAFIAAVQKLPKKPASKNSASEKVKSVKKKTVVIRKVVKDDVDTEEPKNTNLRRSGRKRIKIEEQIVEEKVIEEQVTEVAKPSRKRKSVATKVKREDELPKKRASKRSTR